MSKPKRTLFSDKLIELTNLNYLNWSEVNNKYGEIEALACEVLGGKVVVPVDERTSIYLEKDEEQHQLNIDNKVHLRAAIQDFMRTPWEISAWMDEILGLEIEDEL